MTSLQKLGKTGVFGTPKKMKFVHLEKPEFGESICKCVYIHAMYVHVMYICLYIYTHYMFMYVTMSQVEERKFKTYGLLVI